MKTLLALWVLLNEYIWGFNVCVAWDGKVYNHHAKDLAEAFEWMRQYPSSACCDVLSFGNDRIVATRGHVVVCS